jgi:hypothetical protein
MGNKKAPLKKGGFLIVCQSSVSTNCYLYAISPGRLAVQPSPDRHVSLGRQFGRLSGPKQAGAAVDVAEILD